MMNSMKTAHEKTSGGSPLPRLSMFTSLLCKSLLLPIVLSAVSSARAQDSGCAFAAEAVQIAARIRGLEERYPVRCTTLDRKEFELILRETMVKDLPEARLQAEERAFKILGLLSHSLPYARCVAQSYAEHTVAYYSPSSKKLVIPSWKPVSRAALVHEATHALQDQHFDLSRLRSIHSVTSDRALAATAVIEGDALLVEEQFRKGSGETFEVGDGDESLPADAACDLPDLFRDLFDFAYVYGKRYAQFHLARGGPAALNEVLHTLPAHTSEILRPARGSAHLRGVDLGSSRDGVTLFQETMGEYFVLRWLRDYVSIGDAIHGAEGLRDDRLRLLHHKGRERLTWDLVWDSEKNAFEFLVQFKQLLSSRWKITIDPTVRSFIATTHGGWKVAVTSHAERVALIFEMDEGGKAISVL